LFPYTTLFRSRRIECPNAFKCVRAVTQRCLECLIVLNKPSIGEPLGALCNLILTSTTIRSRDAGFEKFAVGGLSLIQNRRSVGAHGVAAASVAMRVTRRTEIDSDAINVSIHDLFNHDLHLQHSYPCLSAAS